MLVVRLGSFKKKWFRLLKSPVLLAHKDLTQILFLKLKRFCPNSFSLKVWEFCSETPNQTICLLLNKLLMNKRLSLWKNSKRKRKKVFSLVKKKEWRMPKDNSKGEVLEYILAPLVSQGRFSGQERLSIQIIWNLYQLSCQVSTT